jgi:antitoxin ParD1/3/4
VIVVNSIDVARFKIVTVLSWMPAIAYFAYTHRYQLLGERELEYLILGAYVMYIYIKKIMLRQSISFTKPNDEWLKKRVESNEYASKSELINDLVRQARGQQSQVDWIRLKLETAEKSGFTEDRRDEILKISKKSFNG